MCERMSANGSVEAVVDFFPLPGSLFRVQSYFLGFFTGSVIHCGLGVVHGSREILSQYFRSIPFDPITAT